MKKLALAILATTLFSTPAFADHSQVNVQVNPVGTYAWENGRLVKYNHRYRPAPVVITIRDHRNQYVHMVPIRNQYNPHYNTYVPRHHQHRNNDAEKIIKGVIAGALIYDIVKD
jgi:hypothetical protein